MPRHLAVCLGPGQRLQSARQGGGGDGGQLLAGGLGLMPEGGSGSLVPSLGQLQFGQWMGSVQRDTSGGSDYVSQAMLLPALPGTQQGGKEMIPLGTRVLCCRVGILQPPGRRSGHGSSPGDRPWLRDLGPGHARSTATTNISPRDPPGGGEMPKGPFVFRP